MRVLYSFPHEIGAPGIGMTAYHEVRGLVEAGAQVVVHCASTRRALPGATVVETMSLLGRRVPHRAFGSVDRALAFHDWTVARALRKGIDAQVVHAWPLAARRTLTAAKELHRLAVREAPNCHTAYAYERVAAENRMLGVDPPEGSSHRYDASRLKVEYEEYHLADLILVPSEFAERTFLDRGIDGAKLARHRYGFDPAEYPVTGGAGRTVSRPGAGLVAVFVGRCEPRKGLHHALRAWIDSGACQRGQFFICGTFQPGYEAAIGPLLEHPSVRYLGFVEDVPSVMGKADVLVLPSVEEGSALVTYEAQASGCVLLVSDACGALTGHGGALVHEAGDVSALTEHFRLIDRDRGLLEQLRAATLAGSDELTWTRSAQGLLRIYADGWHRLAAPTPC